MAEDIHIDIDFDSMYVDRPASIISEAYSLKQRIELMGLKVSSLNYMSGDIRKKQPKINCRNTKQDFIVLLPHSPDSRPNRQALVMLFLALGKICGIHARNVDVFYKGHDQKTTFSSKHKRGPSQEKFEKSLNNDQLLNQLRAPFERSQSVNLTKIESDLLNLSVNNRISQDVAVQYCYSTGISHQELYFEFSELKYNDSISPARLPRVLELPAVPFDVHMGEINSIIDDLDSEHEGTEVVRWLFLGAALGAGLAHYLL
tara:strand:- start:690 stop:1466 length:777 start_codon:yes stop_codon:yes gene_type:complete